MAIRHIVMSIEGLEKRLAEFKSYSGKNNYCKKAFGLTYKEVLESLDNYKQKGYKFIPSENCKNVGKYGECNCS